LIFALIVAFLAILFAVQNNDPASVHFLVWEYQGSLALILFVALAVGALITFLVAAPSMIRSRCRLPARGSAAALETNLSDTQRQLDETRSKLESPRKLGT
jgi:uncharacterized integral membrane protein